MWQARIECSACGETHAVHAESLPRAFSFDCPATGERVSMPFRDPSKMVTPWQEAEAEEPGSLPALFAEQQGSFDV